MGNRSSVGEVTRAIDPIGAQCDGRSPSARRAKCSAVVKRSPKKSSKAVHVDRELRAAEETRELCKAAERGEVDYVRDLLDMGDVNPNGVDHNHMTALHYAAMQAREDVIKLLLQRGCDPNASDLKGGFTPLHWVVIKANPQTSSTNHVDQSIVALYRGGANVNCTDFNLCTPLHLAAQKGDKVCVDTLIRLGADPERKDGTGRSCLQVARNENVVEQIKQLKHIKDTAVYGVLDTDRCTVASIHS